MPRSYLLRMPRFLLLPNLVLAMFCPGVAANQEHEHSDPVHDKIDFSIRSVQSGDWSDPKSWDLKRVPAKGERVLVSRNTHIKFDVVQPAAEPIRLLQVMGTLEFARDRNTELNVGVLKVQDSDDCSESGFACDFEHVSKSGEPLRGRKGQLPTLLVGTVENPIPAEFTARIRLHYFQGMNREDAPAIACCSARMEIHGSPLNRTWLKLASDAQAGQSRVDVDGDLQGWRVGDQVLLTATTRATGYGSFRPTAKQRKQSQTEERTIRAIDGKSITLDKPLKFEHRGQGEFRGEVANLSRNVIVESSDPDGIRGHTVFHRFSRGGISYARFAHLGKEGVLGRYAIHFHLVGDTMRGSRVQGVSIVDSHNRWVTIHGTQYLIVRDCIGYQSVGHGYFLEDGTEVFNLLDRNLAIQAYRGKRLPNQALPFDLNDGAGFWWANGLNTITGNVSSENEEYGYRYDMQKQRNFDPVLLIRQADGSEKKVDVRTLPIWRFENNEAHAEGFYGMLVAANGNSQPDTPIRDQRMLERIRRIDWTGPDVNHPHMIRDLAIWGSHYAFRPHSPAMRMENIRIHDAAYGVYRPAFENHEYVNLHISSVDAEPFNRGMDDASAQTGKITVDGLKFTTGYGNRSTPLVQISDVNIGGGAETHFRNVTVQRPEQFKDRWPLINRGVGTRVRPITAGVPIYIHDYFGAGRHAKVVSAAADDLLKPESRFREMPPLTGNESRVAEVDNVGWPKLLDPVDDLPPATVITSVERRSVNGGAKLTVRGISHDNGEIVAIEVNGSKARIESVRSGVVDWSIDIDPPQNRQLIARATDDTGNLELTPHKLKLDDSAR